MIKKMIYPKTVRIGNTINSYTITEKLDGSNLVFAKLNGELLICQRNNIYKIEELTKEVAYPGLIGWLDVNSTQLLDSLNEKSAICGEWLVKSHIKYDFDNRFHMFAKANIDIEYKLSNIIYDHDLFMYSFIDKNIPKFISIIEVVKVLSTDPTISILDELYDEYTTKLARKVEGFVIINNNYNIIRKYVRYKNGKFTEHIEKGE